MTDNRRLIQGFLVTGSIGFLVDAGLLHALFVLGYDPLVARAASVLVAITTTWYLNRRFVFRTDGRRTPEYLRHLSAQSVGMLINVAIYTVLIYTSDLFGSQPVFAVVVGSLTAMVFNFLSARYWTYRHNK